MGKVIRLPHQKTLEERDYVLLDLYEKATEAVGQFIDKPGVNNKLVLIHTEIEEVLLSAGLVTFDDETD